MSSYYTNFANLSNKVNFCYYYKRELFYFNIFFYLLMNVLVILKNSCLYINKLFYLKAFGTECVP